jgi:hypothetical protein
MILIKVINSKQKEKEYYTTDASDTGQYPKVIDKASFTLSYNLNHRSSL